MMYHGNWKMHIVSSIRKRYIDAGYILRTQLLLLDLKEAFVQTFGVYILINITVHDKKPAIVE